MEELFEVGQQKWGLRGTKWDYNLQRGALQAIEKGKWVGSQKTASHD